MTSALSWLNSVSLYPASSCPPRPTLPVTPGISWLPTLHSSPLWWKIHLLWVLVLEGLVDLYRNIPLQLLQHYCLGHRLGLVWYWMVCLGNEQRSCCRFWDCIQVLHLDSFVDHEGYSISSKGFLPTVEDIMIWVKFILPVHSSSLTPKMSMFILAISCLITSNLPWFLDLTFQVLMQYCSLQHHILLPSPVTSTTSCCFCFASISSFFPELFLHSSLVAYWAPTDLGSSSFSVLFFAFSYSS